MFGTWESLRTDAILRKVNLDRYDDRDDIRTNLLESYERLTLFVTKHLNDPFYLEGDIRISLRNKIFREAIANILIHREYNNAYTAKMIIGKDKVVFENVNKAHGFGEIDPENFMPFTKNPAIVKVFREIGYAEELGSGVKNLYKYAKLYGGSDSKLVESDVFTTTIMLDEVMTQVNTLVSDQVSDQAILEFCKDGKTISKMMDYVGMKHRTYFRNNTLKPLIEQKLLTLTIPDKPNSPNQKYISVKQVEK